MNCVEATKWIMIYLWSRIRAFFVESDPGFRSVYSQPVTLFLPVPVDAGRGETRDELEFVLYACAK